ncbi:unnamed protein product [Lampetra fluviatilis]
MDVVTRVLPLPPPAGQKACVHLHGVFPYLYVTYDDCGGGQQLPDAFLRQFAFSVDRALNVALGNPSSLEQHVFKISLVSGRPFYGFHEKERLFMKIYLYNPRMVKRVSELLQGGAVMNKSFQPHDAHIPYVLQFFIDYNLYGMNLLKLAAVKFRRGSPPDKRGEVQDSIPEPKPTDAHGVFNSEPMEETQTSLMRRWHAGSIPSSLWLGEEVTRQSRCELELDAVAADILNRLDIEGQIGQNPGLWAIWEDEKQRRRDAGDSSQIGVPASQARLIGDDGQRDIVKQIQEMLQRYSSRVLGRGGRRGHYPLNSPGIWDPGHVSQGGGTCGAARAGRRPLAAAGRRGDGATSPGALHTCSPLLCSWSFSLSLLRPPEEQRHRSCRQTAHLPPPRQHGNRQVSRPSWRPPFRPPQARRSGS